MKTLEMEIAFMQHLGVRQNIIVPNVSWGMLDYEADLVLLTKSNYATEIEIKVSRSDLKKDKEKSIVITVTCLNIYILLYLKIWQILLCLKYLKKLDYTKL